MGKNKARKPALRFSGYSGNYTEVRVRDVLSRVGLPVLVDEEMDYMQIGIRSHGKGLFYKKKVKGIDLGNKRVFWILPNVFILNIVFAWERAVARTTDGDIGRIASHRFPMFEAKPGVADLDYLTWFFVSRKGGHLLGVVSPGGAGRNRTLGQKEFEKLKLYVPSFNEQKDVATFFNSLDDKINVLKEKIDLLGAYKLGVMQDLFSPKENILKKNIKSPGWVEVELSSILTEKTDKNKDERFSREEVLSVSREFGVVNQIEHLGRSYAGESLSGYRVLRRGQIVYTKSPLKDAPYGIIKTNNYKDGIVSVLYAVFECSDNVSNDYLEQYFSMPDNANRYLRPLVFKGAKNAMNISNRRFLEGRIFIPCIEKQGEIAEYLNGIDQKVDLVKEQLKSLLHYRDSMLQKMFA